MKSTVRYLTVAAMVALAACGDDDSVTPSNLTEAEAEELAGAIFSQSFFQALTLQPQPAQTSQGPALATFSESVEVTASCPMGGAVTITGTVNGETDDQTGAGTIDFEMSLFHAGCVVQGEMGTQFTLTGNPSLVFDFLMSTDGAGNSTFSGSLSGAVDWATSGKDGTCSVGYDFSGDASQNGFSFQTSGSICGTDVSQSFTISG